MSWCLTTFGHSDGIANSSLGGHCHAFMYHFYVPTSRFDRKRTEFGAAANALAMKLI
jgi:hypothetical protein